MNRAVLDTNVLVSGLLSSGGPPATMLNEITAGNLTPVYSDPIFEEYAEVLIRPALRLDPDAVLELLLLFGEVAEYISPENDTLAGINHADFPDMDDLPFYAAAFAACCPLVTGNRKHFPDSGPVDVLNPTDFVQLLGKR